jgi:hypothetical protein
MRDDTRLWPWLLGVFAIGAVYGWLCETATIRKASIGPSRDRKRGYKVPVYADQ